MSFQSTNMNTNSPPGQTLYELIGGEAGVRGLVDRFYDQMDADPAYESIRQMHPASLESARDKLFWYLSGWMGGPEMYVERFGHPRMRMRHIHFAIGNAEKDQWLSCMRLALQEAGLEGSVKDRLMDAFGKIATAIRNKPE